MEQGCPHRSILPHIFPDCNSFAIKIGGKFCGARGVCPGGGACLGVAGSAGVIGTRRGACPLCRLPTLPLALISCPHPPSPLPGGKGEIFCLLMQGAAPLASPGLNPRGTGSPCRCGKLNGGACPGVVGAAGVSGARRGACPLCRLLTLPLTCFLAPLPRRGRIDPRPPSRLEGGDYRLFFARGCAPCIPGAEPGRHWFALPLWKTQWGACPGVAGSAGVSGTRRGACLGVAGAAGVSGTRRGACLLCRLHTLPLALFSFPYPPAPFPTGRG